MADPARPARERDLARRRGRGREPVTLTIRHPAHVRGPFPEAPSRLVTSRDGTPIAVFEADTPGRRDEGHGAREHPRVPLILVHGATADHTTFRAVAPRFEASRSVVAIDRRGRGASGDGRT